MTLNRAAPRRSPRFDDLPLSVGSDASPESMLRAVVDAVWDAFGSRESGSLGVSWVGFYSGPGYPCGSVTAGEGEMLLGPSRDTPACSPIGLHGACGRAFLERAPLVVTDVAALGDAYVACDPRDASELVVPCFDRESGVCWGVLDLDSFDRNAFDSSDADALAALLERAGVSGPQRSRPIVV